MNFAAQYMRIMQTDGGVNRIRYIIGADAVHNLYLGVYDRTKASPSFGIDLFNSTVQAGMARCKAHCTATGRGHSDK